MGFSYIDLLILILYLIGVTYFGIKIAGKQSTITDYFLGGRNIPWWAVCLAIVATETSVLTFISIPGLAYLTNLNFLQITFGYLIGRIVVAAVILPAYFRGEISTAYSFLKIRFGDKMKNTASAVFMFTRLGADGVRLFATAIPLAIILRHMFITESLSNEWIYVIAIVVIACASLIYTYIGGLRAVMWIDVVQLFIYLSGAVAAVFLIFHELPGSIRIVLDGAKETGKFEVFRFSIEGGVKGLFTTPYTFIASIIGGAFLSMASHGTDQLIVQRLLSIGDVKKSRKALVLTGVIVIFQFFLFLLLGVLLYVFYAGAPIPSDEVFARFIIQEMPTGLSGLIIAALFAAAMSTLSSSITALASATMYDYVIPYARFVKPDNELKISRIVTLGWSILLIFSALLFMQSTQTVVELALSVASFTYGGLLGSFFLGVLFRRPQQNDALIAFMCGIVVMILVIVLPMLFDSVIAIAWTWYTLIGAVITIGVGNLLAIFSKSKTL